MRDNDRLKTRSLVHTQRAHTGVRNSGTDGFSASRVRGPTDRRTDMAQELDSSDCESGYDIFDIKHDPSLLSSYDESILDDENEIFNMTSIGAFMYLSQNEANRNFGLSTKNDKLEDNIDRTRLSLAYERLHGIPKVLTQQLAPHIKILDISHNEFDNLDFLTNFKQLTTLICDHNNITSSTRIPHIPKLELLWLNHCKIKELYPWARNLQQSCPDLKYLSLMGNAAAPSYLNGGNFYEYLQYRLFVISLFPKLIHLDDRPVTADQRKEAKKMYKRPLFERLVSGGPSYIRQVSGKFSNYLSPAPTFTSPQKNIII